MDMDILEPIIVIWSDGTRTQIEDRIARLIWQEVASGRYASPYEVLTEGLQLLLNDMQEKQPGG